MAVYYVEFAVPPRPTQVYFDRAYACFTQLTPEDIEWDYLLDTRLLHLSGVTVALSPGARTIVTEAVRRAKAERIPVSFDVNFRARLWSAETARRALEPLVRQADLLFCSRADAERLFGISGTPERIVQQLGELSGASRIVVSLAAEGLIGWDREYFSLQPACRVEILDRIGAGDAMAAGVLHGWLGGNFARGLQYGALCAALALSQHGDQVITNRQELEMLLVQKNIDIKR